MPVEQDTNTSYTDGYAGRRATVAKLPTVVKVPFYFIDGLIHWFSADKTPAGKAPIEQMQQVLTDLLVPYAVRHARKLLEKEPR
jgi:hypothetical protein